MYQKPRLYIKHHFRHPQVSQSVAIDQSTDGLKRKTLFLTVFTSVAHVTKLLLREAHTFFSSPTKHMLLNR